MPVIFDPTLNIIKLQLTFTYNLQKLPYSHRCKLTFCQRYWHRTHFTFNIYFFNRQDCPLKCNYFIAINSPISKLMNSCNFYTVIQVRLD